MNAKHHTQPGIMQRFMEEVEARCERIGVTPTALMICAELSPNLWKIWVETGRATSNSMDAVLTELTRLESLRSKR